MSNESRILKPNPGPNVFDFIDYRKFLIAVHDHRKSFLPTFNYTEFARMSGMHSPNLMRLIVQGHRNLTRAKVKKVAKACGLSKEETLYFMAMVNWNQSKTLGDQELHWNEIMSRANAVAKTHMADKKELVAITQWPALALIELTRLPNFQDILKTFKDEYANEFSAEEIDGLFDSLVNAGLLKKTDTGFTATNQSISTGNSDVSRKFIQQYHVTLLISAARAVLKYDVSKRQFDALTVSVGQAEFEEIKTEVKKFSSKILDIINRVENPDRIMQLNVQFYPLFELDGSKKGK